MCTALLPFTFFTRTHKVVFVSVQADGSVHVHSPHASHSLAQVADQPVFVSLAEARAFCQWAGARIMSEPEYHRALDASQQDSR